MFTISNQFLVLTFFRLNEKYFFDNSKSLHKESVNLSVYLIFHYTESTKEKYPPNFFLSFGIGSKNLGICRIGSWGGYVFNKSFNLCLQPPNEGMS